MIRKIHSTEKKWVYWESDQRFLTKNHECISELGKLARRWNEIKSYKTYNYFDHRISKARDRETNRFSDLIRLLWEPLMLKRMWNNIYRGRIFNFFFYMREGNTAAIVYFARERSNGYFDFSRMEFLQSLECFKNNISHTVRWENRLIYFYHILVWSNKVIDVKLVMIVTIINEIINCNNMTCILVNF